MDARDETRSRKPSDTVAAGGGFWTQAYGSRTLGATGLGGSNETAGVRNGGHRVSGRVSFDVGGFDGR